MEEALLTTLTRMQQRTHRMIEMCNDAGTKNARPSFVLGVVREGLARQREELGSLIVKEEKKEKGHEAELGQG